MDFRHSMLTSAANSSPKFDVQWLAKSVLVFGVYATLLKIRGDILKLSNHRERREVNIERIKALPYFGPFEPRTLSSRTLEGPRAVLDCQARDQIHRHAGVDCPIARP
jgi:hypothetical protein